jgi:hypothetical protein
MATSATSLTYQPPTFYNKFNQAVVTDLDDTFFPKKESKGGFK